MSACMTLCQGSNLRAWISLVVLIQCALILLYWDATRGGTTTSKPFPLQAKASHDHLRSQASDANLPDAELRHIRRGKDESETAEGAVNSPVGRNQGGHFRRSDGGAVDGKLTFNADHGSQTKPEVATGRLISPETELLLYKRPKKQRYSGLSDGGDVLVRQQSRQRPGLVQFAEDEIGDKTSKLSGSDGAIPHQGRGRSNMAENGVAGRTDGSKFQDQDSQNSIRSNATDVANMSANISKTSSFSNTNESVLHEGTTPVNDKFLTTNMIPNISGLSKLYENYKKFEMSRMRLNQIPANNTIGPLRWTLAGTENISKIQDNRTAELPDTKTKNLYSSSTKQLFSNFGHQEQPIPKTTPKTKVIRRRLGPTFDTPLPKDPYSLDTLKPVYQTGTKVEFQRTTPDLPEILHLPPGENIEEKYFVRHGDEACFRDGTAIQDDPDQDERSHHTGCLCKRGWHGHRCSIPEGVFSSSGARFVELLRPRTTARRVISALAFNVEFELLEARLHELSDVIDAFIILESNYTNYGDPKPLHLLQRLRDGYLKEFHHKIVYLFRGKIPKGGKDDGWLVDQHMRMFIGQAGMSRVTNTAPDDVFLYTDADEIPNRQSILFLRMHDGYSEPFGVSLRWSVFGFFWKQLEPTRVLVGCTVGMFRYVFNNDAYQLRSTDYQNQASDRLHAYIASGAHIYDWHMGDNGVLSGWHCSWCLPPGRIRIKLTSAINADFPRWGDFPEKLEIPYLRNLVKTGTWFDDKTKFGMLISRQNEEHFAPQYILDNSAKYPYLINLDDA